MLSSASKPYLLFSFCHFERANSFTKVESLSPFENLSERKWKPFLTNFDAFMLWKLNRSTLFLSISISSSLYPDTHTLSLSQFLSHFSFFLHLPLSPPPSLFFPPDSKDSIDSIAFNISAANFLMRPFFLFLFLYLSSYSCRNCKAALISLVTRRRRCIMHECTKSSKSKAMQEKGITYKRVCLHWHLEFLVFVCVFHVKRELGRKAIVVDLFETDVYWKRRSENAFHWDRM
jgi:hypothetical protein